MIILLQSFTQAIGCRVKLATSKWPCVIGAESMVYTPAEKGVYATLWQLAKAYASVNNSGVHQLISHWLHTHAVMEPFLIATAHKQATERASPNSQAFAASTFLRYNVHQRCSSTVFPGKYAMEMSSVLYNDWVFTDQALPTDLLKRNGGRRPRGTTPPTLTYKGLPLRSRWSVSH